MMVRYIDAEQAIYLIENDALLQNTESIMSFRGAIQLLKTNCI